MNPPAGHRADAVASGALRQDANRPEVSQNPTIIEALAELTMITVKGDEDCRFFETADCPSPQIQWT